MSDHSSSADLSLGEWQALESEANFDRVMFGGAEFGLPPPRWSTVRAMSASRSGFR